jgi:DNA-binding Lrp family transcriptional regulator
VVGPLGPEARGIPSHSMTILGALGDASSRRILTSAMARGKTVEEISEEENLPLSTCYRRVREFLDDGLMVLEKLILTRTGKRYAIYRTSFTGVSVRFTSEETVVEATPNLDVIDKLRTKWLSSTYPNLNEGVDFSEDVYACQKGQVQAPERRG